MIAGHDRDFVAALVFPNLGLCRDAGGPRRPIARRPTCVAHPAVRQRFQAIVRRRSRPRAPAAPRSWPRAVLLDEPPSLDAREITDKGSLNQKAVLQHRAALVDDLYAASAVRRACWQTRRRRRHDRPHDHHR